MKAVLITSKAIVLYNEKKYDQARDLYLAAINADDTYAKAYYYLALLEKECNNRAKAIEYCSKAVSLYPNFGVAHALLGDLYLSASNDAYNNAKNVFKKRPRDENISEHVSKAHITASKVTLNDNSNLTLNTDNFAFFTPTKTRAGTIPAEGQKPGLL